MGRDLRRKTVKVIKRYSEALKRQVVLEYERGESTARELVEQYGIGCARTILHWCRSSGARPGEGGRQGEVGRISEA